MVNKKIIKLGKVLNVDGASQPGTLKIRAYPQGIDETALNKTSFTKWSDNDPYVFVSLLPIFFNQAPQEGETVLLFYANPFESTFQDQYWIQFSPSNILNIGGETYEQTLANTGQGDNIAQPKSLVGPSSNTKGKPFNYGSPKLINQNIEGVFPKNSEVAVMGRGTSDVVLGQNSLLLRAGKVYEFVPNQIPKRNFNRAFVNLSHFKEKITTNPEPTIFLYNQTESIPVKKLIIYDVDNLESNPNPPINGTFTGSIKIYELLENEKTLSTNITQDTDFSDSIGSTLFEYTFNSLSLVSATTLINTFLEKSFGDLGLINMPPVPNFQIKEPRYPSFFCFGPNITNGLRNSNPIINKNSNDFKNFVKYFTSSESSIVYGKNLLVQPPKPKKEEVFEKEVEKIDETYTTIGADTIFLLSHLQSIGTEEVNLSNTIDTLDIEDLESFVDKTNSSVRGEKLLDLLDLIVDFVTDHVHNPNESPDEGPYGVRKLTKQKLRDALADARITVLNQNIRIN